MSVFHITVLSSNVPYIICYIMLYTLFSSLQDICNPRRDRYNKKLKKYYVVFEEGDEELSEDEERHTQQDTEALTPVTVQAFFPS